MPKGKLQLSEHGVSVITMAELRANIAEVLSHVVETQQVVNVWRGRRVITIALGGRSVLNDIPEPGYRTPNPEEWDPEAEGSDSEYEAISAFQAAGRAGDH